MRCPSCHAKCLPDAAVCSGCGAALPPDCIPNMRPVSRLAYRICRSGKELLAVFCLSFLIFAGAASTLSCAAAVYEPLTAAAGLDNFSLHTTDGDRPLTEQESALLTEKASQARTLAAKYTVGAVLGLLLFSGSLVLLVRVFFVSSRLRASGGSTEAIPAEQSSAGAERSADTGAAAETGDERRAEPEAEALPAAENSAEAAAGACPSAPDGSGENSAGIAASPENQTKG